MLNVTHGIFDWMGIMQHHDAITGTSTERTGADYIMHLTSAMRNSSHKQKEIH